MVLQQETETTEREGTTAEALEVPMLTLYLDIKSVCLKILIYVFYILPHIL